MPSRIDSKSNDALALPKKVASDLIHSDQLNESGVQKPKNNENDRRNTRKSIFLFRLKDSTASAQAKLFSKKRKTVQGFEITILRNKYIRKWLEAIRLRKKLLNPENLSRKQLYLIGENLFGAPALAQRRGRERVSKIKKTSLKQ